MEKNGTFASPATLPFYSAGGSSVLMLYICVGLVLSVYMHNTKKLFG